MLQPEKDAQQAKSTLNSDQIGYLIQRSQIAQTQARQAAANGNTEAGDWVNYYDKFIMYLQQKGATITMRYLKVFAKDGQEVPVEDVERHLPQEIPGLTVNREGLGETIVNFPDGLPYTAMERVREVMEAAGYKVD